MMSDATDSTNNIKKDNKMADGITTTGRYNMNFLNVYKVFFIVKAKERILMHGITISATIGDNVTMEPLVTEDSDKIEGSGNNIDDDAGK